jgi:transcriptional regulator with XRE-family HTH domain
MGFKDRLKEKRVEANLTQARSRRKSLCYCKDNSKFELGTRKPTKYDIVKKLAEALNTTRSIFSATRNARSRSTGTWRSKAARE